MYNDSINKEYVINQLTSVLGDRLGYPFEVTNVEIIKPDLTVDYIREMRSCEYQVRVKYKLDGKEFSDTLIYPYELNGQFVFSRQEFNARPKISIVLGVYSPVVMAKASGIFFTYDHLYYNNKKFDEELESKSTEELSESGAKSIKYQGEYYSIEEFIKTYPDFKWHEKTILRAKMLAKDKDLPEDFESILVTYLEVDRSAFNEMNLIDIDFQDASSSLTHFLYENRRRIAYKLRTRYESKGDSNLKDYQNYIYRGFQVNTSTNLQSPSVTNPISLQSNRNKLYIVKYNSDRNAEQLPIKYNQSLFGVVCPLKTIDSAKVNIKNEVASNLTFVDGKAHVRVYDRKFNIVSIPISEYAMSKVVTSESWDYEMNSIMEKPTYTQYGRIIKWTSSEPLDWDYLHLENGEFSIGLSCIPMVNSTDSSRATLGAHMLDQALPVNGGEVPIVYTKGLAQNITEKCNISGTITKITPEGIYINTGDRNKFQEYPVPKFSAFHSQCYYQCNKNVGDSVKVGDNIFTLQGFDNDLKVGVNINIAYMHVGYDYEDGVVLRRGILPKFSHRMKTEVVREFTNWEASGLTDDRYDRGLIKVGSYVNQGDILFQGQTSINKSKSLSKLLGGTKLEVKETYPLIHKGLVTDVQVISKDDNLPESWKDFITRDYSSDVTRIIVKIEYDNLPKVGDKFTTLYGSKGVSCKIFEDEDMYRMEDGTFVDAIISPTSTIGRKGLSQLKCGFLAECAKTLWNKHEIAIVNDSLNLNEAISELKALTMSSAFDKMSQDDFIKFHNKTSELKSYRIRSKTIETRYTYKKLKELSELTGVDMRNLHTLHNNKYTVQEKITVTTQYLTRLHFIVEDKSTATADRYRRDLQLNIVNNRSAGQKIGEQEFLAFNAQGMDPSEVLSLERNRMGEEFMLQLLLLGQGVTAVPD